ncbi:hypothetical protein ABZ746_15775 [Streptomyces sp. NPDC020096]
MVATGAGLLTHRRCGRLRRGG